MLFRSLVPEDPRGLRLSIDLKPAMDEQTLDRRLVRDLTEQSRKQLISVMDGLAPHTLAMTLITLLEMDPMTPAHAINASARRKILRILKNLPLTVRVLRGMDEAVITRGGVAVEGINPSTMESKLTPGLYFAGEMIDMDALTGGYNLQIAFSTGALAGKFAARRE